jgi:ABC-type phosphate/phosphonate transport system ATPase subunit
MVKLIIGVKGTGKTKALISMVNEAAEKTNGTVVCIEKGVGLRFDIKHSVRLINTNEYLVFDAEALYGFVAGILASNHDVTDLFIDGALKISNNDVAAFEAFLKELDELISKLDVNVVLTSSIPVEEASDTVKKYL